MTEVMSLVIHDKDVQRVPIFAFRTLQDFGAWIAGEASHLDSHILCATWGRPGRYRVSSAPLIVHNRIPGQRKVWHRTFQTPRYLPTGDAYKVWATVSHWEDGTVVPATILVETYV